MWGTSLFPSAPQDAKEVFSCQGFSEKILLNPQKYPFRREGDRLRQARKALGLTLKAFAARLGVTPQSYGSYENGRAQVPPLKRVAIAEALGAAVAAIWGDEGGTERNVSRAASPTAVREASPAYQVTPLPVLDGFPRTGSSVDGLLWAVEQMSRTITGMVQEARRPEPPKGKRS